MDKGNDSLEAGETASMTWRFTLDKPFLMKEVVFWVALLRLRQPDTRVRELFLTGTPEQLWGYELARNGDVREKKGNEKRMRVRESA